MISFAYHIKISTPIFNTILILVGKELKVFLCVWVCIYKHDSNVPIILVLTLNLGSLKKKKKGFRINFSGSKIIFKIFLLVSFVFGNFLAAVRTKQAIDFSVKLNHLFHSFFPINTYLNLISLWYLKVINYLLSLFIFLLLHYLF